MKRSSSRRAEKHDITKEVEHVAIGLDGRSRDKDGTIRVKRGDTKIGTLREEYGERFSAGDRSHVKLGDQRSSQPPGHPVDLIGRDVAYPVGSIGRDLVKRNYVRYLVERYHRFREADSSFSSGPARFNYAVIFKNIEREFKARTYFVSETRFNDLVGYLQRRIDRTALGKGNRARAIRNYAGPQEYATEQTAQD
jgi:hypothetical protein